MPKKINDHIPGCQSDDEGYIDCPACESNRPQIASDQEHSAKIIALILKGLKDNGCEVVKDTEGNMWIRNHRAESAEKNLAMLREVWISEVKRLHKKIEILQQFQDWGAQAVSSCVASEDAYIEDDKQKAKDNDWDVPLESDYPRPWRDFMNQKWNPKYEEYIKL